MVQDKRAITLSEPPRDGEFLDYEPGVEERLAGAIERAATGTVGMGSVFSSMVSRYPVLALAMAVGLGVVISSLVFHLS